MDEKTFPGNLDSLAPIRDYVAQAAREAGLGRSAVYNLCLAVDEIATNVVAYGYDEAGLKGDLKISAQLEDGSLVVCLEDHGRSYNFAERQSPTPEALAAPLEERAVGGLGIMLARTGVNNLRYTAGKEANVHCFTVTVPPDSQ